DISTTAKLIADEVWKVTGYCFVYKKCEKSRTSDHIKMFTFYCAQFHREEAKQRLDPDVKKWRARLSMDCFDCNSYLHITTSDHFPSLAGIIITHHLLHWGYLDISITEDVEAIIKERVNMPASKVWISAYIYSKLL
ncbi:hypothetical protein CPB84DRAFT_1637618, partial [Gymnopilus junonius]